MQKIRRISIILLALLMFILSINTVNAAIGKKTYARNKYIWIYVNGDRKILPTGYGYPCYGQGTDNKNVLYIPLSVLTDMCGCKISPLKKTMSSTGDYKYYAEVTGTKNFTVNLYSDEINGTKLAGQTFILKGTDAATTNVIMVPLGFAKDFFGLKTEVKRPVGRGVYDYCSLAINITDTASVGGGNSNSNILLPTPSNNGNEGAADQGSDTIFYVHAEDSYYHLATCNTLINDTLRSQLSEYECLYWGFKKCPLCMGNSGANDPSITPVPTTPITPTPTVNPDTPSLTENEAIKRAKETFNYYSLYSHIVNLPDTERVTVSEYNSNPDILKQYMYYKLIEMDGEESFYNCYRKPTIEYYVIDKNGNKLDNFRPGDVQNDLSEAGKGWDSNGNLYQMLDDNVANTTVTPTYYGGNNYYEGKTGKTFLTPSDYSTFRSWIINSQR